MVDGPDYLASVLFFASLFHMFGTCDWGLRCGKKEDNGRADGPDPDGIPNTRTIGNSRSGYECTGTASRL